MITDSARVMTGAGIAPRPVQVRVFWRAFGIGDGGGAGSDGSPLLDPCPWCGGTGSHGGWCPGPYLGMGPGPYINEGRRGG
jgi:hypothetical protein